MLFIFQVEGAFVQGIGYFMTEEYVTNSDGLLISDGTWTYKIPTVDTIPKQFNVKLLNSGFHKKRVLSSKGVMFPYWSHICEHTLDQLVLFCRLDAAVVTRYPSI